MPTGLFQRLLRLFFYLLYHQFSWAYDWVAALVSLGQWKDWVRATLPYIEGPNVLEIGYGPGHLQVDLSQKGFKPIGVDASLPMARQASRRLAASGCGPLLVIGYAQFLPFPSQSFHNVVATFPTKFIFDAYALAEIKRLLVPGGKLIALPVAWINGPRWFDRLAAWLFHVTGQAPKWDDRFIQPFLKAGFAIETRMIEVKSSQILLLIATKPP